MELIFFAVASAIVCFLSLRVLHRIATKVGLTDKPNQRKNHAGEIPLVGGLAIFFSAALVLLSSSPASITLITLLTGFCTLLLGFFDDMFDLDAKFRLAVQIGLGLFLALICDVRIEQLGDVLGLGIVVFSFSLSILFTVFCLVGVLNALNMSDGVDGLVGSIVFITLSAIAYLCWRSGNEPGFLMSITLVAALIPFLFMNLGFLGASRKVFLGDGGSMMLGAILTVLFIYLSQGASPVLNPTTAGWLLGLPLLDSVVVMSRRVVHGKSPLQAGRDHFHHMLIDSGYNARSTVLFLAFIHTMFVMVGLTSHFSSIPESNFFWAFVVTTLLHFVGTPSVAKAIGKRHVANL